MKKNTKFMVPAFAIATALAGFGVADSALAKTGMEKCYGISAAGENECGSLDGKHGCAKAATEDNSMAEWKWVKKGECEDKGGKLMADAKAALENAAENVEETAEATAEATDKKAEKAAKKAEKAAKKAEKKAKK